METVVISSGALSALWGVASFGLGFGLFNLMYAIAIYKDCNERLKKLENPEFFIKKETSYPNEMLKVGDTLKVDGTNEIIKVTGVKDGEPTCLIVEKV